MPVFMGGKRRESSQTEPGPTGQKAAASAWQAGGDLYLQSSKVVPGDASARRLRSSSLSLVTWRSWKRIVSRLSPAGRLSLMAGGGEEASPFTGEPATAGTLATLVLLLTLAKTEHAAFAEVSFLHQAAPTSPLTWTNVSPLIGQLILHIKHIPFSFIH